LPSRLAEHSEPKAGVYPQPADEVPVRWVELETGRVRCLQLGSPDGRPVVLLPGWGCSAYSFRNNVGPLAAAGFRVLVVEPPGQGWSDRPRDEAAYTIAALAANVLQVMDRVGVRTAALIGQSLGGAIALQIALEDPERVGRLVLWSPIGFGCARIVHLGARLPLGLAPLLERLVGPVLIRHALRIVYGRAPEARDVEQYALPIRSEDFVRSQIALLRNVRWDPISASDRARLRLPISIVAGAGDPIVPAHCLADAVVTLPNARLRVLSGAGHAANETHPGQVNREALAFLAASDALPTG
jgi:4,5:9,10-diseco-3-hydroxy-5,9,17-trioxoandrosta-1(10),2-diene-4-oate hydrolase